MLLFYRPLVRISVGWVQLLMWVNMVLENVIDFRLPSFAMGFEEIQDWGIESDSSWFFWVAFKRPALFFYHRQQLFGQSFIHGAHVLEICGC